MRGTRATLGRAVPPLRRAQLSTAHARDRPAAGRAATADGYNMLNRRKRTAHRGMAAWLRRAHRSSRRRMELERQSAPTRAATHAPVVPTEVSERTVPSGSFEVSGRKFPGGSFQAEARPSVRRSRLYVGLVAQRCERQSHRTLAPTRSPPLMKCSSSHAVRRNVAYALPTGVHCMEPKGRGPRDRSGRRRRAQGECGLHCIACAGGPQAHRCK